LNEPQVRVARGGPELCANQAKEEEGGQFGHRFAQPVVLEGEGDLNNIYCSDWVAHFHQAFELNEILHLFLDSNFKHYFHNYEVIN
jgi:hypothetical protein